MPAVQPRTGCDPPGGHGKMGGVGGTGCKQNLEGLARKFAALAPKWRRQKGARRDARPDRAKASRLDPCYIKFRAEIKDSYPDCDDEEEESEEEEESDDYAGASALPGRRKRDPGGQSCTGAASQLTT